jgi:hypothetical protein
VASRRRDGKDEPGEGGKRQDNGVVSLRVCPAGPCDRVETLSLHGLGEGEEHDRWGPNVRVGWVRQETRTYEVGASSVDRHTSERGSRVHTAKKHLIQLTLTSAHQRAWIGLQNRAAAREELGSPHGRHLVNCCQLTTLLRAHVSSYTRAYQGRFVTKERVFGCWSLQIFRHLVHHGPSCLNHQIRHD